MSWLLLMTPEADRWRAAHDWASRYGVSAHVTVRSPFLEPREWPDAARAGLESLLPVRLRLARLEDRPGDLVIMVEPDEQLRELTRAIGGVWPELPRHKEAFERPRYHVTVVRTADLEVRTRASGRQQARPRSGARASRRTRGQPANEASTSEVAIVAPAATTTTTATGFCSRKKNASRTERQVAVRARTAFSTKLGTCRCWRAPRSDAQHPAQGLNGSPARNNREDRDD